MLKYGRRRATRRSALNPAQGVPAPKSDGTSLWRKWSDTIGAEYAVVDVETTGVYNKDRVVEIAILQINATCQITDRWQTMVQPERDISLEVQHIHGISATMVQQAPRFLEIAGDIRDRLNGRLLVGHNILFDLRMLKNEFGRIGGHLFAEGSWFDTSSMWPGKLSDVCQSAGVRTSRWHSAMGDAEATAGLFSLCEDAILSDRIFAQPATVTVSAPVSGRVLLRDGNKFPQIEESSITESYFDLLQEALEDEVLTKEERAELDELAKSLGWCEQTQKAAEREFINREVDKALSDGVVTATERKYIDNLITEVGAVSEESTVNRRTRGYEETTELPETVILTEGDRITLTGQHPTLTRTEIGEKLADRGLITGGLAKKYTRLVLALDAQSESGKASKAREMGIPILPLARLHEIFPGRTIEVKEGPQHLSARNH